MEDDRETQVRNRAHAIWEREGRPEGSHDQHWADAERELDGESGGQEQADSQTVEGDDVANPRAMHEAARQHADTYLVASDLEDDDQRTSSAGLASSRRAWEAAYARLPQNVQQARRPTRRLFCRLAMRFT